MSNAVQAPLLLPLNHPQLNGIGDSKLIHEIRQELYKNLPIIQREINLAIAQHNWIEVRSLMHRLAGTCAYCGATRLQMATEKLRTIIRSNPDELTQVIVDEFNEAVDATRQAVNEQ